MKTKNHSTYKIEANTVENEGSRNRVPVGGRVNWCCHLGRQWGGSPKPKPITPLLDVTCRTVSYHTRDP